MSSKRSTKSKVTEDKHQCNFCKKTFVREASLIKHSCEMKRRWMEKDTRVNQLGFNTYVKFYELNYPGKRKKTYDEFMNSRYFTSFVNFGRHLYNLESVDVMMFVTYLIKNSVALSEWSKMYVYESYVREITKKESLEDAVIRNVLIMKEWSLENGTKWYNFFREVGIDYAKILIKTGRLSPWMLFIGPGDDLISRMSQQDLLDIQNLLDVELWSKKISLNKKPVANIVAMLREAGV